MAYAVLANLSPIYGLYSAIAPNIVYSFFGPSRESAVGAMALVSIMVGNIISGQTSSLRSSEGDHTQQAPLDERVNVAVKLAFVTGLMQIGLGVLKMGEIATYVSHPVMQGFCSGGEILIAISQLKYLFGIKIPAFPYAYQTLEYLFQNIQDTEPWTLLLGLVTFFLLYALSRWRRAARAKLERLRSAALSLDSTTPHAHFWTKKMLLLSNFGPFVAIVATAFVSYGMSRQGVAPAIIGEVPHGLHTYPSYAITLTEFRDLAGASFLLAVISFMLTYSVSKKYAGLNNYVVEPNQELVALGLADFVGSFFGAFPVAGGFARTAVAVEANQKTQASALVAVSIVLLAVNFLTGSFHWIPLCTLAAIVQVAICGVVDFRPFLYAFRASKSEFAVMFTTFAVTLGLGIDKGIIVGVALSIVALVRKTSHPRLKVLGALPGRRHVFRDVTRYTNAVQAPGICIVRIDESLNFASCASIKEQILSIANDPNVVLPKAASSHHHAFGLGGGQGHVEGKGSGEHGHQAPFRSGSPLLSVVRTFKVGGVAGGAEGGAVELTAKEDAVEEGHVRSQAGDNQGAQDDEGTRKKLPRRRGGGTEGGADGALVVSQDVQEEMGEEDLEVSRVLTAAKVSARPKHIVVDFSGVNHIDLSGIKMLDEVEEALQKGLPPQILYVVNVKSTVRDRLKKSPLWDRVGGELCFLSLPALLDHLVGDRYWAGKPRHGCTVENTERQSGSNTPGGQGGDDASETAIWDGYTDWVI